MKILHLIYDDIHNSWLGGGGSQQTLAISKALVERGHEVVVVTGNYPGAKKEEEIEGIKYIRAGCARSVILSRLSFSFQSQKLIRKLNYDVIVDDVSAFSPTFAPLHTKKPAVAVIRNLFGMDAIRKYKILGIHAYLFERYGLKLYKYFIANSPYIEKQLRKMMPGKRIISVPNSVDESLFSLQSTEENFILFIGRIDIYQKGLDTLLQAFKIVSEQKKVVLVIAGEGKDSNKLQTMIYRLGLIDKVVLKGQVGGQAKKELLSQCLFVSMPSRFESFGNVAIEAAACGKAIIGTRIPGLSETIIEEKTGILVEHGNAGAMAETMLRLMNDTSLRKKLGAEGREWARNFSLDRTLRLTETFLLECKPLIMSD